MSVTVCSPLTCLQSDADIKFGLIVLNQPLEPQQAILKNLWPKAVFRACADGAANRLYELTNNDSGLQCEFLPNIISGDFDSAKPEILQFYKEKGVEIVPTPDQDETDFLKCLREVEKRISGPCDYIICLGSFGGRFDHVCSNVNTLYMAETFTKKTVILLSEGSLAMHLPKGEHKLMVNTGFEDDWCGLIPVGMPCLQVTTTGLKWNLDHQPLQFGGLISTSNTYDGSGVVNIQNSSDLLWTMGFQY